MLYVLRISFSIFHFFDTALEHDPVIQSLNIITYFYKL
jgi:hypothetical protein